MRRRLLAVTSVAVVGGAMLTAIQGPVGASAAAIRFGSPLSLQSGLLPWYVVAADLNGDGRPDFIAGNAAGAGRGGVSIFVNKTPKGASHVGFDPAQHLSAGVSPQALAVADFDGDGKPDLAVGNFFTTNLLPLAGSGIYVYANHTDKGSSSVRLDRAATVTAGTAPEIIAVADFNGDGKPDLAFTDYGIPGLSATQDVSVALNTSTGLGHFSFAKRVAYPVGAQPLDVSAVDVNSDGKPDLVVGNNFSASVSVLINETPKGASRPTFSKPVTFSAGSFPLGPETLATGDLNGDGRPDIVTPNFLSNHGISILMNQTSPGSTTADFAPKINLDPGYGPQDIAIGDLNGDGRPDIAVALNQGLGISAVPGVVIYPNETTPGSPQLVLGPPVKLNAGLGPDCVIETDINGDGKPDLVVTDLESGTVTVLLNESAS